MLKIKTLIELFDLCQVENVIAGLRFAPQKIIFVGFDNFMTRKRRLDLESFLKNRQPDTNLEFVTVDRYSYDDIKEKLDTIIDTNEDCCFDLTGGKELVLAAMGHVSAERNVPMVQFNVNNGRLIRVRNSEKYVDYGMSEMSIKDCVCLNGGAIVCDEDDFRWDMNEKFKNDIRSLWGICKRNSRVWNRQITAFSDYILYGRFDERTLTVEADLSHLRSIGQSVFINMKLIELLLKYGYISDFEYTESIIRFKFKNQQIYRCLSKAGNILELYTYTCALEINEQEKGYYNDIDTSVFLDWDGMIHSGSTPAKDTRNEVDVMLMRNLIPVFISCKNGDVKKESLYELSAVAKRLGGKYVKQILIMSHMCSNSSKEYIKQRANDMNIDIIEDVEAMSEAEFISELKSKTKIG